MTNNRCATSLKTSKCAKRLENSKCAKSSKTGQCAKRLKNQKTRDECEEPEYTILFVVKKFMAKINQPTQMHMKVQIQDIQPIQTACNC
jgi:hypothetical protein